MLSIPNKLQDQRDPRAVRQTKQRAALVRILRATDEHPTAQCLHSELRKELPNVSLATVYRLLHALSAEGVIAEIEVGQGARRFDGKPGPHHHIACTACGRTMDVPELLSSGAQEMIAHWSGYTITGVRMSWEGVCPACRDRSGPSNDNSSE